PSRLVFVVDGEETEYTTGEILEMREELWFSRGIALSQACNRSIVDKSLQILRKKRASGYRHQVIAVACSIPHARQIMALYRARGVQTALVHSRMEMAEREATMQKFERGGADVIGQVGLLGEGYDHPPLSIAAIFRPAAAEDRQRSEQELGVVEQIVGGWQERGVSLPHVREVLRQLRAPVEAEPVVLPVTRPDLERHEYRKLLAATVQKAAGRVANELGLGPGLELVPLLGRGGEKSNYQAVIRLINHRLQRRKNKPESG